MGAIDNIPATKQIGDKFLNTEYNGIVEAIKENREAINTAASGFQGDIAPTDNFIPSERPKGFYNPTVLGASYGPTGNKYLEVPENPDEEGDSYIYQVANNGVTITLAKTIVPTGEFITENQKNAPLGVAALDENAELPIESIPLLPYADIQSFQAVTEKTNNIFVDFTDGNVNFRDSNGFVKARITPNGFEVTDLSSWKGSIDEILSRNIDMPSVKLVSTSNYPLAVVDSNEFILWAVDASGKIITDNTDVVGTLFRKKIAFLGDSITVPTTAGNTQDTVYWGLLKRWHNLTVFWNAISGSRITATNPNIVAMTDPSRWGFVDPSENLDAFVIFGGTNDFGDVQAPSPQIGSMSDPDPVSVDSNTTFYSALKYLYRSIHERYKTTKLFHMTPIMRADRNFPPVAGGQYLADFVGAIRDVANLYGVTVIDTFKESGFNYWNMSDTTYSTDKLHPRPNGQILLAQCVEKYLVNAFKTI